MGTRRVLLAVFLLFLCLCAQAGDNRWTSGGPYGGNIRRYFFHPLNPQSVFNFTLMNEGGVLYRSTNSGGTWKRLSLKTYDGFLQIPVSQPRTVLAADGRLTLQKSTDLGTTWHLVSDTDFGGPWYSALTDFEVDPDNPQILYVCHLVVGMHKSIDGGHTWLPIGPPNENGFRGLEIDPSNGKTMFAMTYEGKLFRSTDQGNTWTALKTTPTFSSGSDLLLDKVHVQTVYAVGRVSQTLKDEILKTTDGGDNWGVLKFPGDVFSLALDTQNSQNLYAIGESRNKTVHAFKSTNNGDTWFALPVRESVLKPYSLIFSHPLVADHLFLKSFDYGALRSQDGGNTWKVVNYGIDSREVPDSVAASSSHPGHLLVAAQALYQSENDGRSWKVFRYPSDSDHGFRKVSIHPLDPNVIVASGAGLFTSTDGGTTWTDRGWVYDALFHPTDTRTLYSIGSFSKRFYKSTNLGATWKSYDIGIGPSFDQINAGAVDPRNGNNIIAGTSKGRMFLSHDGILHWKELAPLQGPVNSLVFDPVNSNVLYAGTTNVFKSTDAGKTWSQKSPQGPVVFDPSQPGTVFSFFTTQGQQKIVISRDSGEHWTTFDMKGLSDSHFDALTVEPSSPYTLHLSTTRGVYSYTRR